MNPVPSEIGLDAADTAVSIEGVVKKYGDQTVLREVSLKIRRGEFLTLLGPSGCGKTTLLNLIAGFAEADSGEVFIDGQPVTSEPPHRRQIGLVFQNYALFPHMTVERNIGYGLRMQGVAKDEAARRIRDAMAMVKLDGLGHRKPRELSGGQQQRVAIARALALQPGIVLLDEVTAALDPELVNEVLDTVRMLAADGMTMFIVSHEMGFVREVSSKVVFMDGGHVVEMGSARQIFDEPTQARTREFVGKILRH